ncbi:TPA: type II secretion system F family protein [Bacillus cereus]|uniref:type II secretion system F family protein n=1 Tax=Bacillus cereus TaxID=1396 RepID=UPI000BF405C7|nr:type II secretion system F family protein [Bacillus cereus]PFT46118.1 hypothetical protein COK63_04685 [Bacillus cereus]
MNIISSIILALIGVCIFILIATFFFKDKRKKYTAENILKDLENQKSQMEKRSKEEQDIDIPFTFLDSFFNNFSFTEKIAPSNVIAEARRYEWFIGAKEYWTIYIVGSTLLTGSIFLMLNGHIGCVIGYALGFYIHRFMLHVHRRKYKFVENDRISIYMKTMTNSLHILGTVIDAIEEVKPLVHSSIREELDKATFKLKQGKSVAEALSSLDKKYPYKELMFFHEMLDVADKNGGKNTEALESIALDFEDRKVKQMQLYAETTQGMKAFRNTAAIVIALPFIFKFFMPQAYSILMRTPLGSIVFVFTSLIILYCYTRLQKLADWNPEE